MTFEIVSTRTPGAYLRALEFSALNVWEFFNSPCREVCGHGRPDACLPDALVSLPPDGLE